MISEYEKKTNRNCISAGVGYLGFAFIVYGTTVDCPRTAAVSRVCLSRRVFAGNGGLGLLEDPQQVIVEPLIQS